MYVPLILVTRYHYYIIRRRYVKAPYTTQTWKLSEFTSNICIARIDLCIESRRADTCIELAPRMTYL